MRKLWTWLSLIAVVSIIIAGSIYGPFIFLFPVMFLLCFFLSLGMIIFDAIDQVDANPGLAQLPEPDFWSHVHNAWLYLNKKEVWARYACFFATFGGIVGGSLSGLFILALLNAPLDAQNAVFIGWFLGILLIISSSIMMATSDYWL
jgi:hypothetical protein